MKTNCYDSESYRCSAQRTIHHKSCSWYISPASTSTMQFIRGKKEKDIKNHETRPGIEPVSCLNL
jgi:hypothetical protein